MALKGLLENKQIVHVVAEILVFVCVFVFVSQKTKKIMNHVNDLAQRVEDQEDVIQKHEQEIKELKALISTFISSEKPQLPPEVSSSPKKAQEKVTFATTPLPQMRPSSFIFEAMGVPVPGGIPIIPRKQKTTSFVEEMPDDAEITEVQEEKVLEEKEAPPLEEECQEDSDLDTEIAKELTDLEKDHSLD